MSFRGSVFVSSILAVTTSLLASCSSGGMPAGELSPQAEIDGLSVLLTEQLARLYDDPGRVAAAAPAGRANQVDDLTAESVRREASYFVELSWTEMLTGDYNLDGLVNAQDLTPIAQNWLRPVSWEGRASDFAAWRLRRVDGNRDGLISASDTLPIAEHWKARLDGYRVFRVDLDAGSVVQVRPTDEPLAPLGCRRVKQEGAIVSYRLIDASVPAGRYEYYVVPVDLASGTEGAASRSCFATLGDAADRQAWPEPIIITEHGLAGQWSDGVATEFHGPAGQFAAETDPSLLTNAPAQGATVDWGALDPLYRRNWHVSTVWNDRTDWPVLELVNSEPALVFVDQNSAKIMATTALDAAGKDWREPWVLIEKEANLPALASSPTGAALAWYQRKQVAVGGDTSVSADLMFATIPDLENPEYEPRLVASDVADYFTTNCMHCRPDLDYVDSRPMIAFSSIQQWFQTSYYTPSAVMALIRRGPVGVSQSNSPQAISCMRF